MKHFLERLPSELAPRDSAGLSRPTTAYAMIAISHQAASESSETESRHAGLIPAFPAKSERMKFCLHHPEPCALLAAFTAGRLFGVAIRFSSTICGDSGLLRPTRSTRRLRQSHYRPAPLNKDRAICFPGTELAVIQASPERRTCPATRHAGCSLIRPLTDTRSVPWSESATAAVNQTPETVVPSKGRWRAVTAKQSQRMNSRSTRRTTAHNAKALGSDPSLKSGADKESSARNAKQMGELPSQRAAGLRTARALLCNGRVGQETVAVFPVAQMPEMGALLKRMVAACPLHLDKEHEDLEQLQREHSMTTPVKTIKLTSRLIHTAGSYGGHGFNRKQLDLLKVNWPPRRGWVQWLDGQEIPESVWQSVLALKGKTRKHENKERAGWF